MTDNPVSPSERLQAAAWYEDAHGEVVLLSDALDALEMVPAESVPAEPPRSGFVPGMSVGTGANQLDPPLVASVEAVGLDARHQHRWTDAPDDENGWYCPGCGVIEYPSRQGSIDEAMYAALGTDK